MRAHRSNAHKNLLRNFLITQSFRHKKQYLILPFRKGGKSRRKLFLNTLVAALQRMLFRFGLHQLYPQIRILQL